MIGPFLFLQLLVGFCSGSTCIQREREALLRFHEDLMDPSNRLASWSDGNGDCCQWTGVVCDNHTGHVLELHLQNPHLEYFASGYYKDYDSFDRSRIGGRINPSLLDLKELIHLDLSFNGFQGVQIPKFLSSIKNLRYLNLSGAGFGGMIPQQLGNVSSLQKLDLDNTHFKSYESDYHELYIENLMWIYGHSSLKHLDLSGVINLNSLSSEWLSTMSSLPSLEVLRLSQCELQYSPHQSSLANLSSLISLDISSNSLGASIPSWIFGLYRLEFLDLSHNSFEGPISIGLKNLTSLQHLDLSFNQFNSSIPGWLSANTHLEYLSLSSNNLEGSIPSLLGNLKSLTMLDLSSNQLESSIPTSLGHLNSLTTLDLSFNNLQGSIPISLGNLTSLSTFNLANNRLEGGVPTSFRRLCNLRVISLSALSLRADISQVLEIFSGCVSVKVERLYLASFHLSGHLTDRIGRFEKLITLDLSNNSISGPIPSSLWGLSSLKNLYLVRNQLNATVSQIQLSNLPELVALSLGENSRVIIEANSSWIPPFQLGTLDLRDCRLGPRFPIWLRSQDILLHYVDISNGGISDVIPDWFWKSLSQLQYVNISHNQISQKIPNLTGVGGFIEVLDLSSNGFFGPLPQIYGEAIPILDLSSNSFSGSIIQFLCMEINRGPLCF